MRAMPRFLLVVSLLACLPAAAAAQMVVHTVSLATDGSGDQTVYTRTTFGRVVAVRYVPDATDPMDSGSDITITDNGTGLQVLAVTDIGTSARDFWPRAFSVTTTGSAVVDIHVWKATSSSDPTLVKSTTAATVGYLCAGAD